MLSARRLVAAGFSAALVAGLATVAALAAEQPLDATRQIDDIFAAWNHDDGPGCAVSVTRGDRIQYAKGYGVANLEYGIPITPSTVFHVASISKQFTAMSVALLVADGRVSWDDDIRRYVPELADLGPSITLRHLAHHTSGIRDQWSLLRMAGWRWGADIVRQADVLDVLSRQTALNFAPGREYLYSNSGYTLLAVVVERVSGLSLRTFTQQRLFKPLGMNSTQFRDDNTMIVRNRAFAYEPDGPNEYRINIPAFDVVGATSLFTTVEDLAHWNQNFETADVGGPAVIRQLQEMGTLSTGERISYAFGLIHDTYRGRRIVSHGGTDAGYRSEFVRVTDENLAVAVLCNVGTADPGRLARAVVDIVVQPVASETTAASEAVGLSASAGATRSGTEGDAESPWLEVELPPVAGYYQREESDVPLHIVARGDELVLLANGTAQLLHPLGPGRFRLAGSATEATFDLGNNESAATLNLSGPTQAAYTQTIPVRPSTDTLASYAGSYYSNELAVQYTFRVENGRLTLWNRKLGHIQMIPTFADAFYAEGWYFTFRRDGDGEVSGFTMSTPRAWKVAFRKFI